MNMFQTIFAAMILIEHAPHATCQTAADVTALMKKLSESYDYRVRPTDNQLEPIEITVSLDLLAISELNEAKETIKTSAQLQMFWKDAFLQWSPVDHNGTWSAHWPQDDVWKPDIALVNSNTENKELGVKSFNVVNDEVGHVFWQPFQVFESKCSMDIRNFPFDHQTCHLKFQSWTYYENEVHMKCQSDEIRMEMYETNSGWDLTKSTCKVVNHTLYSQISFSVTIRRKPQNFMLTVVFPIMTLAILNICVFLLPTDSGEKAGYSISVFLAFAVFLTIVSSSLPQNSNSAALIAVFLVIQTTCSTLTTVLALVLLRMSSFDENVAIPRILVFFMRCFKCKSCSKASRIVPIEQRVADSRLSDESEVADSRMSDESEESSTGHAEYSWKQVVNFLDAVLFVIFACILVASSLGCFLTAMNSSKSDLPTYSPPDHYYNLKTDGRTNGLT